MSYLKRNYLNTISYLLSQFPVVAVLGARQVGKSTLLRTMLPGAPFFDLEREADFNRVNHDPSLILREKSKPIIFDEAQLCPALFNAMRVAVDEKRNQSGQFLISGSSSPKLLSQISESLAGRIAIVTIDPLSWDEALAIEPSPFFSLFDGASIDETLQNLSLRMSDEQINSLCLLGGYPEPTIKREDIRFYDIWMENYFRTYIERDVRSLFPSLQLDTYKRFFRMLAVSSGEIINASNFARSLDVSQPTVRHYLEIAEGTFLWRQLPTYDKNVKKRVIKMPKGHIRDSGLLNYLLNINTVDDLKTHPQYGRIWESFIIEQIIRNLNAKLVKYQSYFYRTHNQAEIDLVVEGRFGLVPIEIKSGSSTSTKQLRTLFSFVEEHDCPFGVLINNGEEAFRIKKNIIQVPARFL